MIDIALAVAMYALQGDSTNNPPALGPAGESTAIEFTDLSGYQEDLYQFEITPGSSTVSVSWASSSRAVWGSSYAISSEVFHLYYQGRAKSAANVYLGQRFIQVCMWYSRNSLPITSKVCSNSNSYSGSWISGPEVSVGAWDSLGPNDPRTIFNISTARIAPNAIF